MNASLQYSALARLLTLNNRVHDLQNQLLSTALPVEWRGTNPLVEGTSPSFIARMQEEIDQGVRASLATCWLGLPEEPEE